MVGIFQGPLSRKSSPHTCTRCKFIPDCKIFVFAVNSGKSSIAVPSSSAAKMHSLVLISASRSSCSWAAVKAARAEGVSDGSGFFGVGGRVLFLCALGMLCAAFARFCARTEEAVSGSLVMVPEDPLLMPRCDKEPMMLLRLLWMNEAASWAVFAAPERFSLLGLVLAGDEGSNSSSVFRMLLSSWLQVSSCAASLDCWYCRCEE